MDRRNFFRTLGAGVIALRHGDASVIKRVFRPASDPVSTAMYRYYSRKGLERLQKKFVFREAFSDDTCTIPIASGRKLQWFRYAPVEAREIDTAPKGLK